MSSKKRTRRKRKHKSESKNRSIPAPLCSAPRDNSSYDERDYNGYGNYKPYRNPDRGISAEEYERNKHRYNRNGNGGIDFEEGVWNPTNNHNWGCKCADCALGNIG